MENLPEPEIKLKSDAVVESNINFQRAMQDLHRRIVGPNFLILYWKAIGPHPGPVPWPEIKSPWFEDLS